MLLLDRVGKTYPNGVHALERFSAEIRLGEIVAFTRRDLQDHLLDLWADTRPTLVLVTHDVDEAVVLADRVIVMRPRPGRKFEEIVINLARPRDRNSPLFDNFKRRVLTGLDRSLDRSVPDADAKSTAGEAMWW